MPEIIAIFLRLAFMYLYALVLLRITGKRSLGSLSALDFVATTMLGDMFDNVIWGETAVSTGIVGFGTILLMHTAFAYIGFESPAFDRLVLGNYKDTVVKNGHWDRKGMRRAKLSEDDAWSHLRLLGEDKLDEIQEATVEPSGSFGVLKQEDAKTVQKKDVGLLKERFK